MQGVCLFSYGATRTQRGNMLQYDSWSTGWSESITSPVVGLVVAITMLTGPQVSFGDHLQGPVAGQNVQNVTLSYVQAHVQ